MTMTEGREKSEEEKEEFTERWREKKERARLSLLTLGHRRF
jgi:hypothetical protein